MAELFIESRMIEENINNWRVWPFFCFRIVLPQNYDTYFIAIYCTHIVSTPLTLFYEKLSRATSNQTLYGGNFHVSWQENELKIVF